MFKSEENKNLKYKLSGICDHSGSLHGGHYYAMCKDYKENKWRVYNDTSVTDTGLDIVLNQNPYCFFMFCLKLLPIYSF